MDKQKKTEGWFSSSHLINEYCTFSLNPVSGATLCVPDTEVISRVKTFFAPTDPVGCRGALCFHLQVTCAKVAAVQTPGQVVPQIGEVAIFARLTLCGCGGSAMSRHERARWTLGTFEDLSGYRVSVVKGGNRIHH